MKCMRLSSFQLSLGLWLRCDDGFWTGTPAPHFRASHRHTAGKSVHFGPWQTHKPTDSWTGFISSWPKVVDWIFCFLKAYLLKLFRPVKVGFNVSGYRLQTPEQGAWLEELSRWMWAAPSGGSPDTKGFPCSVFLPSCCQVVHPVTAAAASFLKLDMAFSGFLLLSKAQKLSRNPPCFWSQVVTSETLSLLNWAMTGALPLKCETASVTILT